VPPRLFVAIALALSIGLGLAVSPFASSAPDGLQSVAVKHAFADRSTAGATAARAPAPGYAFPGVRDQRLARGLAGFAGTLAVFAISMGLGALIRRRRWTPATTHLS